MFDVFFTSIFIGMFLLEISNVQMELCTGSKTDRRKKIMKNSGRILKFWLILKFLVIIFGQFKQLQNYPTPDYVLNRSNDVSDYFRVYSKNTKTQK